MVMPENTGISEVDISVNADIADPSDSMTV